MPNFIVPGRVARGLRPSVFGINKDSVQAQNLQAWFPACGPNPFMDLVRGVKLVSTSSTLQGSPLGSTGPSFTTTGGGAQVQCPTALRLAVPITIDAWFTWVGTPGLFSGIFGVDYDTTGSSPYTCYILALDGASPQHYALDWNDGASITQAISSTTITSNVPQHLLGTINAGDQRLYLNGVQIASAGSSAGIAYGSSAPLHMANNTSGTIASNMVFLGGHIWNRAFSAIDAWRMYDPATRWDLCWVPSTKVYFNAPATSTGHQQFLPLLGVA